MWLLNERGDTLCLAASTTAMHPGAIRTSAPAAAIVAHFSHAAACVDIEHATDSWCVVLRECHPSDFPNGGNRLCVPLFGRGELVGVFTLGDRVGGVPFSTQDIELLKCISDHAAACLLNAHLSQRLLQAKQLEAFQAMAAFFVHDLKNAASTLNLMLKNLPVHFDDPEFRKDTLRGIGKTVEHIDGLIRRLSALRHELKVVPRESDLNEIVGAALAGLGELPKSKLEKDIRPVPRIPIDPEQVHKVITNIVLNAAEAVPPGGHVRVSTGQENGWVVLTVDDNGCGMTEEFLERSLFRPFQTTKTNGLGIGMFQSKMIVEAHGGRIAVSSAPGRGTRFQVFLRGPAAAA
jgi:putative PEP-CTERM system histidine kinase